MMKKNMKKRLIRALAAASLGGLLMAGPVMGAEQAASTALEQNQNVQASLTKEAGKKADEKRQEIISEAVSALQETFNALKALEAGKKEEALKALANATGKLELVVARDPKLAFAPVDVSMTTFDVLANAQDVTMARKEVMRLLKEGNLPAARELLNSLRSEVVVSVAAIPLATYPDAIKAVTPLIDQGKVEEAKAALEAALSTLVVTRHVIPLPLLRVDEALVIAEVLAEKKDRDEKENQALENALDAAVEQLKLAEALGYGTHADYEVLQDQIREIREKVSGGKSGTGFFEKLKQSLLELKADIFGSKEEQKPKAADEKKGTTEK
ncbi:MAG: hypothetical protein DSZ00_05765 [Gammaproteobacteria bacterium]|nr:MAG: hypothetical protein DSZ00_05765 [Gammaproteobacteria bacterium]